MSTNTRSRTTREVDSVAVIAKWIRRVGLPLAILAWTGVALLAGLVSAILDVVLVAVLSIYLLAGGSRVSDWLRQNTPQQQQGRMKLLLDTWSIDWANHSR